MQIMTLLPNLKLFKEPQRNSTDLKQNKTINFTCSLQLGKNKDIILII